MYYGELGEGRGEVVRVVPGMRLKLVTGSAVEVIIEEFMEELLNQTGGIVLDVAVGDGVDPSAEVIADEAVIAVLNTSGAQYEWWTIGYPARWLTRLVSQFGFYISILSITDNYLAGLCLQLQLRGPRERQLGQRIESLQ